MTNDPSKERQPVSSVDLKKNAAFREKVLRYLQGNGRSLLPPSSKISPEDLTNLLLASEAEPATVVYLQTLHADREKFSNLQELTAAVSDLHQATLRERTQVLRYLFRPQSIGCTLISPNVGITPASVLNLFDDAGAGLFTLYHLRLLTREGQQYHSIQELTEAVKTSFQKSLAEKQAILAFLGDNRTNLLDMNLKVKPKDVTRLMMESGGEASTLSHCRELSLQGCHFSSLDSLIRAVKLGAEARQQVLLYLAGTAIFFQGTSDVPKFVTKSFSPSERRQAKAQVDRLFEEGRAGTSTLSYIQEIQSSGLPIHSIDDIIEGVKGSLNLRRDVLHLLMDDSCAILKDKTVLSLEAVDQMFKEGPAGSDMLSILKEFDRSMRRFDSIADLIVGVREAVEQVTAHRDVVRSYLNSSEQTLLLRHGSVTSEEVEMLFDVGHAGLDTLGHLKSFEDIGEEFSSISGMSKALKIAHEAFVVDKNAVYSFLKDRKQCGLLEDCRDENAITVLDVDRLFEKSNLGRSTYAYVKYLSRMNHRFDSISSLVDMMVKIYKDRSDIFEYLLDTQAGGGAQLLTNYFGLTNEDVDRILLATRAGGSTLNHLKALASDNHEYVSIDELISAVLGLKTLLEGLRGEVLVYLLRGDSRLLQPDFSPDADFVQLLFDRTKAGKYTMYHLKNLNKRGIHDYRAMELIEAVQAAHAQFLLDRNKLMGYLSDRKQCRVLEAFSGGFDSIDRIFLEGQAGVHTVNQLKILEQTGVRCKNVDELVEAIREALVHKQQVHTFLETTGRSLLSPEVEISSEAVESLFDVVQAGPETMTYLIDLQSSGATRQHSSFDSLIAAVKERHSLYKAYRSNVLLYLGPSQPGQSLLEPQVIVSQASVERLFQDTKAGSFTIYHLRRLVEEQRIYSSMEALVEDVKQAHGILLEGVDRVFRYLRGLTPGENGLFQSSIPNFNREDVHRVFEECQGASAYDTLKFLETREVQVRTIDELVEEVQKSVQARRELRAYISDPKQCNVWDAATPISMSQVDALFFEEKIGKDIFALLAGLEGEGKKFSDIKTLTEAIHNTLVDRGAVEAYLLDPESGGKLYRTNKLAVKADIVKLFSEAHAGSSTLSHLQAFSDQDRHFGSLDALVVAVSDEHQSSLSHRKKVYNYLTNSRTCQLFEGRLGGTLSIRPQEVDVLFDSARAGSFTLHHLRTLSDLGKHVSSMSELSELVKVAHRTLVHEQRATLAYLNDITQNQLLESTSHEGSVSMSQNLQLFRDGDAGYQTKRRLQELQEAGYRFDTFDSLIKAVAESQGKRVRVLEYLRDATQHTLLAYDSTTVNSDDVDRLFMFTASVMPHLLNLNENLRTFATFADLVSAVQQSERARQHHDIRRTTNILNGSVVLVQAGGGQPRKFPTAPPHGPGSAQPRHPDSPSSAYQSQEDKKRNEKYLDYKNDILGYLFDQDQQTLLRCNVEENDFDQLYFGPDAGLDVLHVLRDLNREGRKFATVANLVDEVKIKYARFRLAASMSNGRILADKKINVDVDAILKHSGASELSILGYVEDMLRLCTKYSSVSEFLGALKSGHEKSKRLREHCCKYLSKAGSVLFSAPCTSAALSADVDHLFEYTKAGPSTISYLREMEKAGMRFEDIKSMTRPIIQLHQNSLGLRNSMMKYLLFQSHLVERSLVTPSSVETLFVEAACDARIPQVLQNLEKSGNRFRTFEELTETVKLTISGYES